MNLHPALAPASWGFAGWRNESNQQPKEELRPGRAAKGWVVKRGLADSFYWHGCNLSAQQRSAPNCASDAAPHQCHHPWRHFSPAPFLPISSRGRFNKHEATAAAACVDVPPPFYPALSGRLSFAGRFFKGQSWGWAYSCAHLRRACVSLQVCGVCSPLVPRASACLSPLLCFTRSIPIWL